MIDRYTAVIYCVGTPPAQLELPAFLFPKRTPRKSRDRVTCQAAGTTRGWPSILFAISA